MGRIKPEIPGSHAQPYIRGLTTNPTLMRKSVYIIDYEVFARDILVTVIAQADFTGIVR